MPFLDIARAIIPVFTVILLGLAFRRAQFPGNGFWAPAEQLSYYLLLPLILFRSMMDANFSVLQGGGLLLSVVAVLLLLTTGACYVSRWLLPHMQDGSFASLHQGAVRFNNYVGLPVTLSLFGDSGVAVYAAIIALAIPLSNVQTVWVMSHRCHQGRVNLHQLGKNIITHPLIVATLGGVAWNMVGGSFGLFRPVIDTLAYAALPIGLLCVGAGIDFSKVRGTRRIVAAGVVLKLLCKPALAWLLAIAVGLPPLQQGVLVIFASLPSATTSYILSKKMGADAPLMANITAVNTLFALGTMPIVLLLVLS